MDAIDLGPAGDALLEVASGVREDQLDHPTPCEGRTVRQLLWHVVGLTSAFRAAAEKEFGELTDTNPDTSGWLPVDPDWQSRLAGQTHALVAAWATPGAWEGMTRVGGQDLPGEVAGLVALNELVLHGWDLAVATGQGYRIDEATAQACLAFVESFDEAGTPGLFGPSVEVPADAGLVDRLVARAGRNPGWTA